jgi:hypothetical protein
MSNHSKGTWGGRGNHLLRRATAANDDTDKVVDKIWRDALDHRSKASLKVGEINVARAGESTGNKRASTVGRIGERYVDIVALRWMSTKHWVEAAHRRTAVFVLAPSVAMYPMVATEMLTFVFGSSIRISCL